jgi:hypothetical protein
MGKQFISILKSQFLGKVLSVLFVISSLISKAQILIPNTTPLTENFDAMGTSATASLPANWKMSVAGAAAPTWAAGGNFTAVNQQASAGAPATGARYNWGTTPATDRAAGFMTSGSYASPNSIMAFYQNTNASNLTQLTVSYDAERYRINTAAASIQFFYSLNGTAWTAVTAGDVAAASFTTGASAYTFGTPLVISVGSFNITGLNIATNGTIYLRWNLNTTGSNSQGIGIDNVSVTAAFTTPCTPPTTTITPTSQTVCANVTTSITVSSSATTPTYQWQMSANGSTGWANVANGTPTGVTYSGGTAATLSVVGTASAQYYYQCLVTEGGTCTATTNTASIAIVAGPSITSQPVSVSTTSTGTASYTVTASGTGLSYQWQENSGSGFSTVSNGGSNPTYAGATTSVLTISNPPLSMSGYSYQCIVSNSCGTVTTNGTATLTVTVASSSVCPYFVAAVVNACAGSCSGEGNNEFVVMNSGSYSIPVNGTDLNVVYNNGIDNYFTQSYAAQPGVIANLNSLAGCGTLFVDASTGTIPANSTFFIMNQGSCFNSGSFSAYCGVGTIYVAFSTDATWSSAGFFGNNNSTRFFRTDFTSINAGCGAVTYNYNVSNEFSFGSDGASVVFNGTTPSYVTGGGDCVPPVTILPISLLDFYGTRNGEVNELVWKVAEEENILNYVVEKSEDAIHFTELGTVSLNHNKAGSSVKTYNLADNAPFKGITYYRLSTTEANGSRIHHKTISLDENAKEWEYSHYQQDADLIVEFKNAVPKNSTMDLFDLSGKLQGSKTIDQSRVKMNVNDLASGIYFVRITTAYKTKNFKIVIQK